MLPTNPIPSLLAPLPVTVNFQDGTATPQVNTPAPGTPDAGATGGAPGGQGATGGGGLMSWMPLVVIFAIFWFLMIGPERKQRKKREEMLSLLKKGDKVVTNAGIFGQVVQIQDEVVTLQIADGVRIRMSRAAIQDLEHAKEQKEEKEAKASA